MKNDQSRHRGGGRRGRGAFGPDRFGRPSTTAAEREEIAAWFAGNLVDGWFTGPPTLTIDDYEILVIGSVAGAAEAGAAGEQPAAEQARAERFREDTRERRIQIALAAEERFGRKVSWGVTVGATTVHFTTANVPVMTRLNLGQRRVLDTLVDAGVARSRSEALAWCVELVDENEQEWIERLRTALDSVEQARAEGPTSV